MKIGLLENEISNKKGNKPFIMIVNPGSLELPTHRPGGIQEILWQISKLLKDDFNVIIVSPFLFKYIKNITNGRITIDYVYYPAIKKYPPTNKIEIILSFIGSLLIYTLLVCIKIIKYKNVIKLIIINDKSNIILIVISKLLKIKTIFSEGNPYPWYVPYIGKKPSIFSWGINISFAILSCKLANKIIAQSIMIRKGMIDQGIPENKIEIIPAGVDANLFKPNNKYNNFVVGFLGRLTDEKGAKLLIEIIKICEKELPNIKFIIIGSGPYENDIKECKNIAFQKTLPRYLLPQFINTATIFISTYYDFSLSDLEILSCGKPLIKINTPEMKPFFKDWEEIVFCKKDARDFVEKIKLFYKNKELVKRIGENARKKVEKEFDWHVIGKRWVKLINDLLNS
jgi:glycosyltransferase involved in cell wall biosynthesis